jgi:hypothetical protein
MKKLIAKLGEMKQFEYFLMLAGICGIAYAIIMIIKILPTLF